MDRGRTPILGAIAPFLLFVVLSLGLTYPLVLHLGTHLRDNGDSYEYAWVIGFGAHQIAHDPLHLYDGNIFYPYPLSLAYSDSTVPNIVLGAPIVWLTDNPVLALNVLILLTYVLGGYGMYLFVRQRTGSPGAGLVAGILYAFTPYRYDHLAQLPNVSMEWAPFALWSFDRYVAHGKYRWAAGFALFTVLQVLVSFYYAFILGIGILIHVVAAMARSWRTVVRPRWLLPWCGFCALGALVAAPFILPYFELERSFGLSRSLGEAAAFSAWPGNFLAPTPTMLVIPALPVVRALLHVDPFGPALAGSERRLYPGTLIVALALVGIVAGRSRRAIAPLVKTLVGVALCFGPYLHVHPNVAHPLPFPMPYAVLFDYLPGFAALRVPSRFDALVILGLAILAGDGVAALQGWLGRRRKAESSPSLGSVVLVGACAALGVIEGINYFPLTPVPVGASVPPVYRWLAADPTPGAVLELPIDDNAYHESPRSYLSTYDHRPLVDGFRSFLPPSYDDLASVLQTFPSPAAVATIERLGVRYVVVHRAELDASQREVLETSSLPAGVQIAAKLGDDVVYRVQSSFPPDTASLVVAMAGCPPQPGAPGSLDVQIRPGSGLPIVVLKPGTRGLPFTLNWIGPGGASRRETSTVAIPSAVLASSTQVVVPYQAPSGASYHLDRVSLDAAGLTGAADVGGLTLAPDAVGSSPAPLWLRGATLLSTRVPRGIGPSYQLTWRQIVKPRDTLVVFVNAYDRDDRYWSFPTGREDTFPRATDCLDQSILETDQLAVQPDTPPGRYWVEAGLIDPSTKQRVPFLSTDGKLVTRVVIGSFWVYPPGVYGPGALPLPRGPSYVLGDTISLDDATVDGGLVPGGKLAVALRWTDRRPMTTDYTVFVHVVDSSGTILAQYDGQPAEGKYPTSAWQPGESVVDHVSVALPKAIPAGSYDVQVGLYDLKSGKRLIVSGSDGRPIGDHLTIARLK